MKKSLFITGTDTGVGKTFVAAGLIRAMKEKGLKVCPMKPVETGCRKKGGKLVPSDAVKLIKSAGVEESLDTVNPYRFSHPLAPAVAAEIEDAVIKKSRIISSYQSLLKKYDVTVVEGAGGVMVPVYKKYLFIDLMKDLKIPVLIVSRPGLGTINHTLLTIEALRSRGIGVIGVVFNYIQSRVKGLPEKTNPEVIEKLGGVPVLGTVPYTNTPYTSDCKKIFDQIGGEALSRL